MRETEGYLTDKERGIEPQEGLPAEEPLEGLPQNQMVQGEYTPDKTLSRAELLEQKDDVAKGRVHQEGTEARTQGTERNTEEILNIMREQQATEKTPEGAERREQ